jgi:hypothetical protein
MINDASAPILPREGHGMKYAFLTDERVARDLVFFEPHIPPGTYRPVFLLRGFGCGMDELLHCRGVRDATILPVIDGFERVAGE